MIQAYLNQMPEKFTSPTIGNLFFSKKMVVDGKDFNVQVWDTAGQERFKSITPTTYKDADGVVFVCDLTEKNSLFGLRDWVKNVQEYAPKKIGSSIRN